MAQTTILASGASDAKSSNFTIARGVSIAVGIFADVGVVLPNGELLDIMMDTPATDIKIVSLSNQMPACLVNGPGTFYVRRRPTVVNIGVFTEDA